MIVGFIVICGYTLGAPQTVEGCRPYMMIFKEIEYCETAGVGAGDLDFGPGTYLEHSQCLELGEEV